ncbi:ATP-binding protein [Cohnella faecalis]
MPSTDNWQRPGILIERLYGLDISVFEGSRLIFESNRDFIYERNKLLLPVDPLPVKTDYYVRIKGKERAGFSSDIQVGEFERLSDQYVRKGLPDLLLGTSIAFLALIMLICSGYLNRRQRRSWISLCLIALTTGTLIVAYSPLPYIYFEDYGNVLLIFFDISMFVLFPALSTYIDDVFEGRFVYFKKFRRFQTAYSAFCLAALCLYKATDGKYYALYDFFSNTILGPLILIQLIFIIVLAVRNAINGNKNAAILSVGIFLLALSGAADLTIYYLSETRYVLFLWKFGIIIMIVTLVVILARRISADYAMLVTYSKELELYNHNLQRTEKMKIISDLAASVAHEVRNPLQVTRGFLQLLSEKSDLENKNYFGMAINELDRASTIITDFLTFAKPEMETLVMLDLSEEIKKIEGIMSPLAALHGGILVIDIPENLHIYGNSSKLKQAFINIIKNSIEAIGKDGVIGIYAYSTERDVILRISDNGEGMEEEKLASLGEPFFSTKSKGTGLGLMVTFRIIEAMKGSIEFRSTKGKGTEAIIRFPLIKQS